jgi:hypothetical protein
MQWVRLSAFSSKLAHMSTRSAPTPSRSTAAADANTAIRAFVAGRKTWTQSDLAELARLRRVWMSATQGSVTRAA